MWIVDTPDLTVAAFVKARAGIAWSVAKRHVAAGRVFVDGERVVAIDHRLAIGQQVELRVSAPRPPDPEREGTLAFDDAHIVVIDKPAGVSSVPFQPRRRGAPAPRTAIDKRAERAGTAMDMIRATWRRLGKPATSVPLHVVHRIDRATSGLLAFAKTKRAELGLAAQLRAHEMDREYVCVAHGEVRAGRIESQLVPDRGDGLRGSTTDPHRGKRAVTHVAVERALRGATLCRVRLETGKTHQIRIHLAESGHPLVGETVYVRDYHGPVIASPRLLLHAATLGFVHPITGERVTLASPLPDDFVAMIDRLT